MHRLHIALEHASLTLEPARVRALVSHALEQEACSLDYLGIIFTDGATIRALNKRYRGGDYDTDVLSFPLGKDAAIDGEIYVSLDCAAARCAEFGTSFEMEALRYAVHGLLHLAGYRDEDETGRRAMRAREDRYLRHLAQFSDHLLDDPGTLHDIEMDAGDAVVE